MEDLRGQTPEMVKKEIWAHCLSYNLIRKTMCQAAQWHACRVREISFTGALQSITASWDQAITGSAEWVRQLAESQLESLGYGKVGKRPNRVEPRAVKRRPRKQKLLTKPREEAQAELLNASA